MSEFNVDAAKGMIAAEAKTNVKNDNEYTASIGQGVYDKVMTGFGVNKEERERFIDAQNKTMEATFHFHTEQMINNIKQTVAEKKDPKQVTQATSMNMDRDMFTIRSNAYSHGELTVRNEQGENVKKPWEKYGKTTFNMSVERRFDKGTITEAQDRVKRSFDD